MTTRTGIFSVALSLFLAFSSAAHAEDFQTVINQQKANADALMNQVATEVSHAGFLQGPSLTPNADVQGATASIQAQAANAQALENDVAAEQKALDDVKNVKIWV